MITFFLSLLTLSALAHVYTWLALQRLLHAKRIDDALWERQSRLNAITLERLGALGRFDARLSPYRGLN